MRVYFEEKKPQIFTTWLQELSNNQLSEKSAVMYYGIWCCWGRQTVSWLHAKLILKNCIRKIHEISDLFASLQKLLFKCWVQESHWKELLNTRFIQSWKETIKLLHLCSLNIQCINCDFGNLISRKLLSSFLYFWFVFFFFFTYPLRITEISALTTE